MRSIDAGLVEHLDEPAMNKFNSKDFGIIAVFILLVFFFFSVGHPAGLDGFVGCIYLTYFRDSSTNIRIRVCITRLSLFRENAS